MAAGGGLGALGWGLVGVGGLLVYAGMTGGSLVGELQGILAGKSPAQLVKAGAGSSAVGAGPMVPAVAGPAGSANAGERRVIAPASAGASSGALVDFGHKLQAMGYQVSEHPAFGGVHPVHVAGSLHYSGRAIDVNHGAGQSASEQAALDTIAPVARAAGFRVLWRVPGHFNHLHLDTGGRQ